MNEPLPNELLSAWLDGELTAEQRASMNAHLASHPQDAQLMEELRGLQTQLRSMPRYTAPSGLSDAVVQKVLAADSEWVSPPPSWAQTAQRNAWLVTCAASLIGLILIGFFYRINQDAGPRVAMQPGSSKDRSDADAATGLDSARPSDLANGAAGLSDLAGDADSKKQPPAGEVAQSGERDPHAAAELEKSIAQNAPADSPDRAADALRSLAAAEPAAEPKGAEENKKLDAALAMGKAGGGFGGGLPDRAEEQRDDLMADARQQLPVAPAEAVEGAPESATGVDGQPGFDQLIIVRAPAGRSGEEWIASVFAETSVRVDAEQPSDFDEQLAQRQQQKAGANARSREAPPVLRDAPAEYKFGAEIASDFERLQGNLGLKESQSPIPDVGVEAYMIDAEQHQFRQIMDRLEGSVVMEMPNQVPIESADQFKAETRRENLAYPASPAVARRLSTQLLRNEADGAMSGETASKDARAAESDEASRGESAESAKQALAGSDHRQRYLIVVLGPLPATDESASPEDAAAPQPGPPPAKK
jgi:anti-sigma factor RsiW